MNLKQSYLIVIIICLLTKVLAAQQDKIWEYSITGNIVAKGGEPVFHDQIIDCNPKNKEYIVHDRMQSFFNHIHSSTNYSAGTSHNIRCLNNNWFILKSSNETWIITTSNTNYTFFSVSEKGFLGDLSSEISALNDLIYNDEKVMFNLSSSLFVLEITKINELLGIHFDSTISMLQSLSEAIEKANNQDISRPIQLFNNNPKLTIQNLIRYSLLREISQIPIP